MHPPTKDQTDIGQDSPTVDASESAENRDMARQEFKNEADINYMLSRFNITQPRGTPTYGVVDDNLDLQTALNAIDEAERAYMRLPEKLRRKFTNMNEITHAVLTGALVIRDGAIDEPTPPEPTANP